jgi:hypothetical protein
MRLMDTPGLKVAHVWKGRNRTLVGVLARLMAYILSLQTTLSRELHKLRCKMHADDTGQLSTCNCLSDPSSLQT